MLRLFAGITFLYLYSIMGSDLRASTYPCQGCNIDSAQEIINRKLENQFRRIQDQNVTFAQFLDGTDKGYTLDEILQANPPGAGICSIDDAIQIINQGLAKAYKKREVQGQCVSFADFLNQMAGRGTTARSLPQPVMDYAVQRFADVGIYNPDADWINWFAQEEYEEDQNLVLAMLLAANAGFFNVYPDDLFFLSHDLRHFRDRLHDIDERTRRRGDRDDPRAINLSSLVRKPGTKSDPSKFQKTGKDLMSKVKSADPSKWKEKTPATNALHGVVGATKTLPATERHPAPIRSLEKPTEKISRQSTKAIRPTTKLQRESVVRPSHQASPRFTPHESSSARGESSHESSGRKR